MTDILPDLSLEQLFLNARTYNQFSDEEISDETLRQMYNLLKWGPTSMNTQPGRYVFIKGREAKEKLVPLLMEGNRKKTLSAPVTVIVASDSAFYEHLPSQYPANPDGAKMFSSNQDLAGATAFRNSTLQGAYLIMAARSLGLDCGPMSGFDNAAVDKAFFPDGRYKSNFLINLGYGAVGGTHPRGPRLPFETVAEIL